MLACPQKQLRLHIKTLKMNGHHSFCWARSPEPVWEYSFCAKLVRRRNRAESMRRLFQTEGKRVCG